MHPFAHRLLIAALPLSLLGVAVSHASEVDLPQHHGLDRLRHQLQRLRSSCRHRQHAAE